MTAPAEPLASVPRRSRWRRKRWVTAALRLWACVVYPLSIGPALYAHARGWLPTTVAHGYIWPMEGIYELVDAVGDGYENYIDECEDAGERHAAAN